MVARLGLRVLALSLLISVLGGCGFHLRGSQVGVSGLVVFIDSKTPFGEFEQVLSDSMRQADMVVGESADTAGMVVQLRGERMTRRVQTVNTTGRAADYELILTVEYVLRSTKAAPESVGESESRKLDSRREYNFDNAELLGKAEEEALLVQEMRRDIVSRMLRQIAYQAARPS